jgi:hypothetical protein
MIDNCVFVLGLVSGWGWMERNWAGQTRGTLRRTSCVPSFTGSVGLQHSSLFGSAIHLINRLMLTWSAGGVAGSNRFSYPDQRRWEERCIRADCLFCISSAWGIASVFPALRHTISDFRASSQVAKNVQRVSSPLSSPWGRWETWGRTSLRRVDIFVFGC